VRHKGQTYSFDAGTIGSTITIPAGSVFRDLVITPIDDDVFDDDNEDVKLRVRAANADPYTIVFIIVANAHIVSYTGVPTLATVSLHHPVRRGQGRILRPRRHHHAPRLVPARGNSAAVNRRTPAGPGHHSGIAPPDREPNENHGHALYSRNAARTV